MRVHANYTNEGRNAVDGTIDGIYSKSGTCLERKRRFKTLLNVPDGYSSWDGVRNAVWSLAVGKGHHMWVLGFHIYFAPQLIENCTILGVKLVIIVNECG